MIVGANQTHCIKERWNFFENTANPKSLTGKSEIDDAVSEINALLKGKNQYYSYYIGEKETNLYFSDEFF